MTRPIPDLADRFVAGAEGDILRVYDDQRPAHILAPGDKVLGTLTAGTGHTGPDLYIGLVVTPAMSDAWRRADLGTAASRLEDKVKSARIDQLSLHQYGAMLSFVFNLGTPGTTIWALLNAGSFDQVPTQIMRFDKAKKDGVLVEVPGLIHRRMAEVALWKTADDAVGSRVVNVPTTDEIAAGARTTVTTVDTVAAPLAILNAAPLPPPPSSVTRSISTPPTPMATKPLHQSKSFIAQVTTAVVSLGGLATPVISQIHDGAQTVADAIKPYVDGSGHVAAVESGLMVVLAATAALSVLLTIRKRDKMRDG